MKRLLIDSLENLRSSAIRSRQRSLTAVCELIGIESKGSSVDFRSAGTSQAIAVRSSVSDDPLVTIERMIEKEPVAALLTAVACGVAFEFIGPRVSPATLDTIAAILLRTRAGA